MDSRHLPGLRAQKDHRHVFPHTVAIRETYAAGKIQLPAGHFVPDIVFHQAGQESLLDHPVRFRIVGRNHVAFLLPEVQEKVAVDEVGTGAAGGFIHLFQHILFHPVVGVAVIDKVPGRGGQARVAGGGQSLVHLVGQDPRIPVRMIPDFFFQDGPAFVRRSVVDKDEFHLPQRLLQEGNRAAPDERGYFVEGDDDRYFHEAERVRTRRMKSMSDELNFLANRALEWANVLKSSAVQSYRQPSFHPIRRRLPFHSSVVL